MKKMMITILTLMLLISIPAGAMSASTVKCKTYTISTGKTTVYKNSSLTKKSGTVTGSTLLTVLSISGKSCKISYTSSSKKKTGYISTKAILRSTSGKTSKVHKTLTAYRRPGGKSCGSVTKGSKVKILGTKGKYTQIRFTRSGTTWFAFVKTSCLRSALK